jgi:gliding motility-associated-like protein
LVSSEATFEFVIYNKWGKQVFYTTEITDRWDGKINGEYAMQGVYTYVVRVSEPTIEPYELVGTVTLLR